MKISSRYAARLAVLLAFVAAPAAAVQADGAKVFAARCAVCHLPNAQGSPGFVPPLTQTLGNYVHVSEGRALLAGIVLYGLRGPITIAGQKYMGVMSVQPPLSDQEAADALNHVLTEYNKTSLPADFQPYTAEEVQRYRADHQDAAKNHTLRQALVEKLRGEGKTR